MIFTTNFLHVNRVISIFVLTCLSAGLSGAFYGAQEKQPAKTPNNSTGSPSGAALYNKHCAVCHGLDMKGTGPVPDPYRTPPDLTTLARRHSGKFPADYVSKVLKNGVLLPAHGPAQMPVWGTEFEASDRLDRSQVSKRITALTNYIKSAQQK